MSTCWCVCIYSSEDARLGYEKCQNHVAGSGAQICFCFHFHLVLNLDILCDIIVLFLIIYSIGMRKKDPFAQYMMTSMIAMKCIYIEIRADQLILFSLSLQYQQA